LKITRFEDLESWQQGRELTRMVYTVTNRTEFKKDLRLSGQIQAAATSTMANCAEGFIRRSDKEFIQFLFIAMSSAAEVQSHLYVALDQGYIERPVSTDLRPGGQNGKDHIRHDQIPSLKITVSDQTDQMTKPTKQTRQTKRPNRPNRPNDQIDQTDETTKRPNRPNDETTK